MPPLSAPIRRLVALQATRALAAWTLILAALLAWPVRAELQRVTLGERFYLIDLPDQPQGAPMILALHGGGGDPVQFARSSGLGPQATAQGHAVVFPAGSGRGGDRLLTWNGGYCCGFAARKGVDDIAFLTAVIDDAAARFGLDGGQVFVTGMSNGSIMAETFAALRPGRVAAVAGVAGTMDTATTRPRGAVPLMVIHGTADAMVPFAGGRGDDSLTQTDFAPVDSVVAAFLAAGPGPMAQATRRIDRVDDGTAVDVTDWRKGGQLWLRQITVIGGAHHWPGSRKARLASGKTAEIDATDEILRFFAEVRR